MADSFVQLATDGSGKKVDTRTESTNNEHRQVFVIGDATTNAGVAPVDATNGVTVQGAATGTALPVSAATLPLPSGAATAAKQPALGVAGTSSADVITIQGRASMTPVLVDPSGVTSPVSLASTTITGTVAVTESGTWTVQPGNTANTTPWLATLSPATTGGLTTFHLVSGASTNATNVKASAGQLFGYYIYNSNAAARKVAFHNTAGTPTAGASVLFSIVIPPTAGANVEFSMGIPFSTGVAITTVTGLADSDATAVAVNDLIINLFYK